MVFATLSHGNQDFFHKTLAVLVHLFAIYTIRVVAITIAGN